MNVVITNSDRCARFDVDQPLFQRCDIGREVAGLQTRQRHVGHFRMRVEQEQRDLGGIEAGFSCDRREGRRLIGCWAALSRRDDVASRAPAVSKARAVVGVGRICGLRQAPRVIAMQRTTRPNSRDDDIEVLSGSRGTVAPTVQLIRACRHQSPASSRLERS
jgi:hypothetical protein